MHNLKLSEEVANTDNKEEDEEKNDETGLSSKHLPFGAYISTEEATPPGFKVPETLAYKCYRRFQTQGSNSAP